MKTPPATPLLHAMRRPLLAVALALPLMAAAQSKVAAPASLSGPSTARVSETATFRASGLGPQRAVSIAVTAPDGGEAHYSAVTGPDGTLAYSLTPTRAGMHTLRVLDTSGKVMVKLSVRAAG